MLLRVNLTIGCKQTSKLSVIVIHISTSPITITSLSREIIAVVVGSVEMWISQAHATFPFSLEDFKRPLKRFHTMWTTFPQPSIGVERRWISVKKRWIRSG
jgi:hypothetical protein